MIIARGFSRVSNNYIKAATTFQANARPSSSWHSFGMPLQGHPSVSQPHRRPLPVQSVGKRYYSTNDNTIITKPEILKLIQSEKDYLLIDVRNEKEVQSSGIIPTAINVPMHILFQGLTMSPDLLEETYKMPLPPKDKLIIVYCAKGSRSTAAYHFLRQMGYTNVKNYSGSYYDWQS